VDDARSGANWYWRSLRRAVERAWPVPDRAFDALYPPAVREQSEQFWFPVRIARRAAALLVTDRTTRVLDVGSGPGKFCIVGALTTPGTFVGIEHRQSLVEAARSAARRCNVHRTSFVHGTIESIDWRRFNAFYFYNPFAEDDFDHYDRSVDIGPERRLRDLEFARAFLEVAEPGSRVVTYHGLGAAMPGSFVRTAFEYVGPHVLELWVRT
jgi:predicted RNA methylase